MHWVGLGWDMVILKSCSIWTKCISHVRQVLLTWKCLIFNKHIALILLIKRICKYALLLTFYTILSEYNQFNILNDHMHIKQIIYGIKHVKFIAFNMLNGQYTGLVINKWYEPNNKLVRWVNGFIEPYFNPIYLTNRLNMWNRSLS